MLRHKIPMRSDKLYHLSKKATMKLLLSPYLPFFGRVIGKFSMRPKFLIIGTQKGGTASLYNYLAAHPRILPATVKEVHYFSFNFHCGEGWYRSHFPNQRHGRKQFLTYEASPYYLYMPSAPDRIAAFDPQMKLIVLLREPISRAYSHYQMSVRQGSEKLSFENAVEHENERLQQEQARFGPERAFVEGISHRHHSYLKRGYYAEQLDRWFAHFPAEQLLILKSEDFFADPRRIHREVLDFLELPLVLLSAYPHYNKGNKPLPISKSLQRQLEQHFAPHNTRLEQLLDRSFYSLTTLSTVPKSE